MSPRDDLWDTIGVPRPEGDLTLEEVQVVGPQLVSIAMELSSIIERLEHLAVRLDTSKLVDPETKRAQQQARWKPEEDKYILDHASDGTLELARATGRSPIAIGHRLRKLGESRVSKRKAWTPGEDATLLEYGTINVDQAARLSRILGRSVNALRTRHSRLKTQQ